MDIPVIKKERKASIEQKLQESGERLSALSEWLYENTAVSGTEYDSKMAAYHAELRRYDSLEMEYRELTGEQKPELKKAEQNARSNTDKKYKLKY